MAKEFKSFYKTVGGGEGSKCHYPTRLDMYGCGCQHNCDYCYGRSLLDFRKLWNAEEPAVADIRKIERKLDKIEKGAVLRLGGMTDCFMPLEKTVRNTYETIKLLNERGIGYLIVTKGHIVADDEYMELYDKDLAHIQVSLTYTDEKGRTDKASSPVKRIEAIEKLAGAGFDVAIRLSPYIPQYIDADIINAIKCDKLLVEFLRVNGWIKKWLPMDYSDWTVKEGGYQHLPLEKKIELLGRLHKKEMTVCEDVQSHYDYWQEHFNVNPDDCCNLRHCPDKLG